MVVLEVRRYRCRSCEHTVTVVPRGVVGRRHYRASAIALACWLWSFGGLSLGRTRAQVAPGRTDEPGWAAVPSFHTFRVRSFDAVTRVACGVKVTLVTVSRCLLSGGTARPEV